MKYKYVLGYTVYYTHNNTIFIFYNIYERIIISVRTRWADQGQGWPDIF